MVNRLNFDLRHDWRGKYVLTSGMMSTRNLAALEVYKQGRLNSLLDIVKQLTIVKYRMFEDVAFNGAITDLKANDGVTAQDFDTRTCVHVTKAQAKVLLHQAPTRAAPV